MISLSVCTDALDRFDGSSLRRIIEQPHDCSWLRGLCGISVIQEVEIKE